MQAYLLFFSQNLNRQAPETAYWRTPLDFIIVCQIRQTPACS